MGFCPYFLHEKSSAGMSDIFKLVVGTLIVLFCLSFLFFEQWHRPEEPLHLPEKLFSERLQLLFKQDDDRGGLPAEDPRERVVIGKAEEDEACLLSASPVNDDDMFHELAREISGEQGKQLIDFPAAAETTQSFLGAGGRSRTV